MAVQNWIRLDNASNIFLAARNAIDTKVFRMTAEMTDPIQPQILQEALNKTYEEYPLFQSVLRRGFFWYYLQKSDVNPRIKKETGLPVTDIYYSGEQNFLFRVLYRENQIHLEVFHVLTDGTGAIWFFEDLITEYVRLLHGQEIAYTRQKADLEDSFQRYFKDKEESTYFSRLVKPLSELVQEQKEKGGLLPQWIDDVPDKPVYQIKGSYNPDHRPRIILVQFPVKPVLDKAREMGVSLTIYMTGLFIQSIYLAKENKEEDTTISVSIPINLRQFFPSITVRNFFSTTTVQYTFKKGEEASLAAICQEINQQFQKQLEKDAIENRLKRLIAFEFHPAARIILRPIKDLVLKGFNQLANRKITGAMSNMGRFSLPDEMGAYVQDFYFYTSVIRPQFCMSSYKDHMNITFTSPFSEIEIYQHFVRLLTEEGIQVTVDANKVTSEELEADEALFELSDEN